MSLAGVSCIVPFREFFGPTAAEYMSQFLGCVGLGGAGFSGAAAFVSAGFLVAGLAAVPLPLWISMCTILTGFSGRLFRPSQVAPPAQGMRAILFTSSTVLSSHWPKMI